MYNSVIDQIPTMKRAKNFVKKYGVKCKWISEKTDIPSCRLSAWMNQNELLPHSQHERMKDFLNEYETLMAGFSYLKDSE
jgi:hypothetical protein